jgi:general secretion pathway protein F
MPTFRYRAATLSGAMRTGTLQGASSGDVLSQLRAQGLLPIEAVRASEASAAKRRVRPDAASRQAVATLFSEIAVLLTAGLTLDRALRLSIENTPNRKVRAEAERLASRVKEGAPLSTAISESNGLLPPLAAALAEAGEASGSLDTSLARLAQMLERSETLRQTVVSALIYPAILIVIAISVILVMLLWIVPQFETVFSEGIDRLPPMTQLVMAASHATQDYGLYVLVALIVAPFVVMQVLRRPAVRLVADRRLLDLPLLGPVVRKAETARFARTLGNLVENGVALHQALAISERALSNNHMAAAIRRAGISMKEGGGLSGPLQQTRVLPPLAISFLRTGEETAQLGAMLIRLADVLDRDVRTAIDRLVSVLTPVLTIVMGAIVATVIASIMTAILGFNDIALGGS